jgi:PAS domain S-box-containing protein
MISGKKLLLHLENAIVGVAGRAALKARLQSWANKRLADNNLSLRPVEHAGDAIEITDARGRFEYVNSAFERIFGYGRDEAIGATPFTLLMHHASDEPDYQAVQQAIERGEVWQGKLVARRKDGSRFHQEATISPVRQAEGGISHFVAVKRDISERIHAEQQESPAVEQDGPDVLGERAEELKKSERHTGCSRSEVWRSRSNV